MTDGAALPPPQPEPDLHPDDSADLDVGPSFKALRLDTASQAILELGQRVDRRNADRERSARTLADLAKRCHEQGTLDSRIAGALRVVGAALDVSSERLRQAVADALDGDVPA
jgi:hypothetical protein